MSSFEWCMSYSFIRKNETDAGQTWRLLKWIVTGSTKSFAIFFCSAYISAWENDKFIIFFLKDASWQALQKLHREISINWFSWCFPYSIGATYIIVQCSSILSMIKMFGRPFLFYNRDLSCSLCKAFDSASFKKKIKVLSLSQAEIYTKQKKPSKRFCHAQHAETLHYHVGCSYWAWKTSWELVSRDFCMQFL